MRAAIAFAAWAAGTLTALADPPFLSRGWTFGEPDAASLYANVCAACHLADGGGAVSAGSYPALAGDERLNSTEYALTLLLAGQGAMPALGRAMTDAQLADLVNYIRLRFVGLADDPATAERAAAARAGLKR